MSDDRPQPDRPAPRRAGVTRRELADALGVHYQTVGYLERGEYSPSLYLALRIAEFFEVPVEVKFSLDPVPARQRPGGPPGLTR